MRGVSFSGIIETDDSFRGVHREKEGGRIGSSKVVDVQNFKNNVSSPASAFKFEFMASELTYKKES